MLGIIPKKIFDNPYPIVNISLSHDYISTVFNRTANSILFSKDSKFGELVHLYLSSR